MLPDNKLSSQVIQAPWKYDYPIMSSHIDYSMGGVELNDVSQGLNSHLWKMAYNEQELILKREDRAESKTILSLADIQKVSFAFDQNMNLCYAIELNNEIQYHFYDSQEQKTVSLRLDGVRSPYVVLDDDRVANVLNSDVLLCYIRHDLLCVRNQRDRYQQEYILQTLDVDDAVIRRVGMAKNLRMLFELEI